VEYLAITLYNPEMVW